MLQTAIRRRVVPNTSQGTAKKPTPHSTAPPRGGTQPRSTGPSGASGTGSGAAHSGQLVLVPASRESRPVAGRRKPNGGTRRKPSGTQVTRPQPFTFNTQTRRDKRGSGEKGSEAETVSARAIGGASGLQSHGDKENRVMVFVPTAWSSDNPVVLPRTQSRTSCDGARTSGATPDSPALWSGSTLSTNSLRHMAYRKFCTGNKSAGVANQADEVVLADAEEGSDCRFHRLAVSGIAEPARSGSILRNTSKGGTTCQKGNSDGCSRTSSQQRDRRHVTFRPDDAEEVLQFDVDDWHRVPSSRSQRRPARGDLQQQLQQQQQQQAYANQSDNVGRGFSPICTSESRTDCIESVGLVPGQEKSRSHLRPSIRDLYNNESPQHPPAAAAAVVAAAPAAAVHGTVAVSSVLASS